MLAHAATRGLSQFAGSQPRERGKAENGMVMEGRTFPPELPRQSLFFTQTPTQSAGMASPRICLSFPGSSQAHPFHDGSSIPYLCPLFSPTRLITTFPALLYVHMNARLVLQIQRRISQMRLLTSKELKVFQLCVKMQFFSKNQNSAVQAKASRILYDMHVLRTSVLKEKLRVVSTSLLVST